MIIFVLEIQQLLPFKSTECLYFKSIPSHYFLTLLTFSVVHGVLQREIKVCDISSRRSHFLFQVIDFKVLFIHFCVPNFLYLK